MGPSIGGGHHMHPVEWLREHKKRLHDMLARVTDAELIALELDRQFALFPEAPKKPERDA